MLGSLFIPMAAHAGPRGKGSVITNGNCDEINAIVEVDRVVLDRHLPAGWHDRYDYLPAPGGRGKALLYQYVTRCDDQAIGNRIMGDDPREPDPLVFQTFIVIAPESLPGFACCNLYTLKMLTNNQDLVAYMRRGPVPVPDSPRSSPIAYSNDLTWRMDATSVDASSPDFTLHADAPVPTEFWPGGMFSDPATSPIKDWFDSPAGPIQVTATTQETATSAGRGTLTAKRHGSLRGILGAGPNPFTAPNARGINYQPAHHPPVYATP